MLGGPWKLGELAAELPVDAVQLSVFLLTALGVASFLVALQPRSVRAHLDRRMNSVASALASKAKGDVEAGRRRQVEDAIRELQMRERTRERRRSRPTLLARLRQSGLAWSRYTYLLVSATVACAVFLLCTVAVGLGLVMSLGFAIAGALLLPHFYLLRVRARRLKAFGVGFPNALDTIVRGIQAGIPLTDTLRTVAAEAQEPVRSEFSQIIQDMVLGLPLEGALARFVDRVPLSEVSFFAIVLTVQARTGGNLSEALSNLSVVLRDRSKMRMKIRAMSSEAKASAMIIGALPVVVAGVLSLTSLDYILLLFSTSVGHFAIAGSLVWMLIGTLVMRQMINFDF